MFSLLIGKQKLSWEISTALWVLGYNPEMMRWRRVHYYMRSKIIGSLLNYSPRNFGPAKMDVQLTGGKQDGSSIWSTGDEDLIIILDRYVCVDDISHVDPRKEDKDHVYFQIEAVQDSPGYVYLKKCPLTKLDLENSAMDRLVSSSCNENGYLSSQKWNRIIYENVKTCEEQLKGIVQNGIIRFDQAIRNSCSYRWFETENDEFPNIIIRYKGKDFAGMNSIDVIYGALSCLNARRIETWAKRQRRHDWPSSSVIEKVLKMPVHIVPKGFKGSETRALEFRLSYVFSEMALMQSLNDTQSQLYSLLKLLVKSTVDKRFPDILTSYCLKNVVFWICEGNPQQMFDNGSPVDLLEMCLKFIRDRVKVEQLSMYLMPERNLLEGKIHDGNKRDLLSLITEHISKLETVVFDTFPSIKKIIEDVIRKDPVHCIALGVLLHKGEMWLVSDRMKTLKGHPVLYETFMGLFYTNLYNKSMRC